MPEQKRKKGKHLDFDDRQTIQRGLGKNKSFRKIADEVGCTPEAISREIQIHRYCKPMNENNLYRPNYCKYRDTCRRRNVCDKPKSHRCRIACRKCPSCNKLCPDFVYEPCKILNKAPYVCNGCRKSSCSFDRYFYYAPNAQKEYEEKLVNSRLGISKTREEIIAMDEIVSPLLLKGQPLNHIYEVHKDSLKCSLRSLYNYINQGCFTAKRMDLRRAVRYKRRSKRDEGRNRKNESVKKEGHKYEDFLKIMEKNPDVEIVEMDKVERVKGGKLLQTFLLESQIYALHILLIQRK